MTDYPMRRRRFTLIEMLVVIAVIAVLMALLLPALNNAKEASRRISCAGNLRQIGIAMAGYTNDYNGHYPHVSQGYGAGVWRGWTLDLAGYDGRKPISDGEVQLGTWDNSRKALSLYNCPSNPWADAVGSVSYGMNRGNNATWLPTLSGSSFAGIAATTSWTVPEPAANRWTARVEQISAPSQVFAVVEKFLSPTVSPWYQGMTADGPGTSFVNGQLYGGARYHNGISNYLFCDGHSASMRPQDTVSHVGNLELFPAGYWSANVADDQY